MRASCRRWRVVIALAHAVSSSGSISHGRRHRAHAHAYAQLAPPRPQRTHTRTPAEALVTARTGTDERRAGGVRGSAGHITWPARAALTRVPETRASAGTQVCSAGTAQPGQGVHLENVVSRSYREA